MPIALVVLATVFFLLVCCSSLCYIFRAPRPRLIISRVSDVPPPPPNTGLEELGVSVTSTGILCFLPGGSDAPTCFVCFEAPAVGNTGPCGHGGMCGLCYAKIWCGRHAKCPICRCGKITRPDAP